MQVFAQAGLWTEVLPIDSPQAQSRGSNMSFMPSRYRLLTLDESLLATILSPSNVARTTAPGAISLDLPLPKDKMASVEIVESAVLTPSLASKYPDIKTYSIQSSNGSGLSGRVDYTQQGFHTMLDTEQGTVFIDPRQNRCDRIYISYCGNYT